jgi:hypothetical protein
VTFANNAIDEAIAGNQEVDPLVVDWFVNVPTDLRLAPEGVTAFADIAIWSAGDPLVDIEGDERANLDGTSEHAGADLP